MGGPGAAGTRGAGAGGGGAAHDGRWRFGVLFGLGGCWGGDGSRVSTLTTWVDWRGVDAHANDFSTINTHACTQTSTIQTITPKKTQGDTFLELVQGYLWPWHAETAAAAPGSQAWG